MKRTKMINIIIEMLGVDPNEDKLYLAEIILSQIEKSGMLPPIIEGDTYVFWEAPTAEDVTETYCKWDEE